MSKLLLVDADPLSLRVLDVSLRKAGFEVETARDREGALAKLATSVPDLLMIDTRLREGDGFSLVKSLRDREGAGDLPVIFLSSTESPEELEQAAALGVQDVMAKPVFVRELLARVQLLLARRLQGSVSGGPVTGTTGELALVNLLQSLEATHTTGVVELEHEDTVARIYMREGAVVDAELDRLRGAEVVFRALGWDQASFRVQPGPVDNDDLLECTTHALLLRAMDRLDGLTPAPPAILVSERSPSLDPAAEREPATLAAADPPLDTSPGASARERSVPSTAPWTREAEPTAAPTQEADVLHAAGVPGTRSRAIRRAALVAAAAGAALLVVIGLRSVHDRQQQESERARAQLPTTSAAVAAAGPSRPGEPGTSPALATSPVAEEDTAATPGTDTTPASDTTTGPDALAVTAAGASSTAPAVDPRETALDVKTALHARSALVRDAQTALLKGDTGKAKALAQQAALTSPYDAEGWLTLAAARKASGDLGGARDAYAQCVAKAHTVGVMSCRALAASVASP